MIIALARSYMASGKYLISLLPFFFSFPKSIVLVEVTESDNRMPFISVATSPPLSLSFSFYLLSPFVFKSNLTMDP